MSDPTTSSFAASYSLLENTINEGLLILAVRALWSSFFVCLGPFSPWPPYTCDSLSFLVSRLTKALHATYHEAHKIPSSQISDAATHETSQGVIRLTTCSGNLQR